MTGMISARKAAGDAGVPLRIVKRACRDNLIFSVRIDGILWLQPEVLSELDLDWLAIKTMGRITSRRPGKLDFYKNRRKG